MSDVRPAEWLGLYSPPPRGQNHHVRQMVYAKYPGFHGPGLVVRPADAGQDLALHIARRRRVVTGPLSRQIPLNKIYWGPTGSSLVPLIGTSTPNANRKCSGKLLVTIDVCPIRTDTCPHNGYVHREGLPMDYSEPVSRHLGSTENW